MTHILGISAFYHDSAACLIRNGEIIAAAQEERFTRIKHDQNFPINAVKSCLTQAGITIKEIQLIAFYDKPFLKFERLLETYLQFAPKGLKSFLASMPVWIKEKLWIRDIIAKKLEFEGSILFPEHHESHAASAFFPSPFDSAAILTMDGVGEWTTTSFGIGVQNKTKIFSEIKFPHSLGLLYSAFTYYTGFKVNSGEYKIMGLAPYGEPKYVDKILNELIDVKEDGSFKMDMKYFDYCAGLTMTNEKFNSLFGGKPRKPETKLTQKEMDLARSIQGVTEMIVLKMARHVREETNEKYLCLAGGVALNCVANGKILKEKIFDKIWIQPASGDAGGAIGAALAVWYEYLGNKRLPDKNDSMKGSYLGVEFSEDEIKNFLLYNNIPFEELKNDFLFDRTAKLLADGSVIGWFQGKMEFGPRALGNRSILADARNPEMQAKLNLKIKFREGFRPFAPSILTERVNDYFELNEPSPYMLLVADVIESRRKKDDEDRSELWGIDKLNLPRSDVPAITHIDYSARIQTVRKETNETYYNLLKKFEELTGCPLIINTSFNVRGEPIVCTPEDAYRCFMRTNIDYLALGNFLLDKKNQPEANKEIYDKQKFELD